ncbi:MAG TPA: PAS domain S-box protein, partial [Acidimicrobiales bacterium]|nr:PAS domain S-box protein [Acidimicrobiales bacterium]
MERLVVRVEAMLGALDEAVIATDLQGTIVYWNPAAERLYGWRRDEAVGRKVHELVVPEGAFDKAEEILDAVRAGRRWSGEFAVSRRDGTVFLASVTDSPVLGEDGSVVGMVGVSSDVGERRWNDAQRRPDGEGLELALAAARVGTWRSDLDTGAVAWDNAMHALFGVAAGGFGGTVKAWFDLAHPDDRPALKGTLERAAESGEFALEHRVLWPDGSVRWIEGRGRITLDEEGRPTGSVGVAVDVTDRKVAEQALRAEHQIVETLHHIGRSLAAELDLERIVQAVTDAA